MSGGKTKAAVKPGVERHSLLTWAVSGVGLLVILATLVVVILDARVPATPPDLRVLETGRATTAGVTRVMIEIRNLGGEAAASVEIEGASSSGDVAHVNLDYVAGRSHREATLAFSGDPGPVAVSARGWTQP